MHWSVLQRVKGLVAPDRPIRGVPLQSLAGIRVVTLVLLTVAHHGMHIPRAPLLNNFVTRKVSASTILSDINASIVTQMRGAFDSAKNDKRQRRKR